MAERDSPRGTSDAPRPNHRRRDNHGDPSRVANDNPPGALPPEAESSYRAASPDPPRAATARPSPPRNRALALKLTAPQVVAITDKQHQEAVDLLAAMIVSWVQRERTDPADTPEQS